MGSSRIPRAEDSSHRGAGFTLVELLVASTLVSLIMATVYFAFNTTVREWRIGEANVETYQAARTAFDIIERELQSVLPGSEYLFEGDDHRLEFYAHVPPMNVEKDNSPRVMWVRYRLMPDPETSMRILVREEAPVEGAFPLPRPNHRENASTVVDLGKKEKFELAYDVTDFRIRYLWLPKPRTPGHEEPEAAPKWVEPVVQEDNSRGTGLPRAVEVSLTIADSSTPEGQTRLSTCVVFRAPGKKPDEDRANAGQGVRL